MPVSPPKSPANCDTLLDSSITHFCFYQMFDTSKRLYAMLSVGRTLVKNGEYNTVSIEGMLIVNQHRINTFFYFYNRLQKFFCFIAAGCNKKTAFRFRDLLSIPRPKV